MDNAKYGRVKMKKIAIQQMDTNLYIKDMWYCMVQDESGVTIISDDSEHWFDLSYDESERYLCKE